MKERTNELTEIELMAFDMERLFIEAEKRQTLPKKHPSIIKAEALYNAGYRKQIEAVWVESVCDFTDGSQAVENYNCSNCYYEAFDNDKRFCPNCGAKMKGGAE